MVHTGSTTHVSNKIDRVVVIGPQCTRFEQEINKHRHSEAFQYDVGMCMFVHTVHGWCCSKLPSPTATKDMRAVEVHM